MGSEKRAMEDGVDACIVRQPKAICYGTYAFKDLEGSKESLRELGMSVSGD